MDPFGLGLCSACGYCHSLQATRPSAQGTALSKIELDTSPKPRPKQQASSESIRVARRYPQGLLLPVGVAVGLLVAALILAISLPVNSSLRANAGLLEISVGFFALLGAHYFACKLCNPNAAVVVSREKTDGKQIPAGKNVSLLAFGAIWRTVWTEMPETKAYLTGATCGVALFTGGLVLYIPTRSAASDQRQAATAKSEAESKAKSKHEEETKKERKSAADRLAQLTGQPGKPGFTPMRGGNNLTPVQPGKPTETKPKRLEDKRPTSPCVILGYTTNSSKQLTGLVLGMAKDGQVIFAGLAEVTDDDDRVKLEVKLSGLRRGDALIEVPGVQAMWVKPTVYCEVHNSGTNDVGRLDQPRFRALIED